MEKLAVLICVFIISGTSLSYTVDLARNLKAIVEYDRIEGSCDSYFDLIDDNERKNNKAQKSYIDHGLGELEILCGKWIFFYLGIKSNVGIPEPLLKSTKFYFKEEVGENYSNFGFYPDPVFSGQGLGLVPVRPHNRRLKDILVPKQRQISCAGCHVGQLPDGRFSVGMPNEKLDLAKFNKYMVFPIWLVSKRKDDPEIFIPEMVTFFKSLLVKMKQAPKHLPNTLDLAKLTSKIMPGRSMNKIIQQYPPSLGDQRSYLHARPGVFNAASPLISFGDREIYTSVPPIWGMTHEEDNPRTGYLGAITAASNLEAFIKHAYVYTTYTTDYSVNKYVKPLAAYLRSLKAPRKQGLINKNLLEQGKKNFLKDCVSCHDGPHGESSFRVPIETVGTPEELSGIFNDYVDPNFQSRRLLEGLQEVHPFEPIRYGIKSRRLNGIWARRFLMTNGSIMNFDHLFCINGSKRDKFKRSGLSDKVHEDLCHLPHSDKLALIEYLQSL